MWPSVFFLVTRTERYSHVLNTYMNKIVIALLLVPFDQAWTVSTQIEIYGFKTSTCDVEIKTKYHSESNKHELIVDGKKYQLVGTICPY